jgi:hypothetical protein
MWYHFSFFLKSVKRADHNMEIDQYLTGHKLRLRKLIYSEK